MLYCPTVKFLNTDVFLVLPKSLRLDRLGGVVTVREGIRNQKLGKSELESQRATLGKEPA